MSIPIFGLGYWEAEKSRTRAAAGLCIIAAAYLLSAAELVMTEQTQTALTQVFHDVFDDDSIVLRPDLSASDVDGWDSLAHVRLLLTVERKFGIKFNAVEVGKLKNAGELAELIETKLSSPARK